MMQTPLGAWRIISRDDLLRRAFDGQRSGRARGKWLSVKDYKMERLLESVDDPSDIRKLGPEQLSQLAGEIRDEVLSAVSEVGGHLASTLGAVELTLALHYVFHTPKDRIVWDTGHQAYAHKLICGRRSKLSTIRQLGGLSGFLSREESEYDVFGAGHAGTSVSAALGMVEAKALQGG